MTPVSTCAGRRVALFGLGGSGLATAHALKAGGADVIVADDSASAVEKARVEGFAAADLAAMDWTGIGTLVLSPGVPLTHKGGQPFTHPVVAAARAAGAEVIGDIELFCRERAARAPDSPFIAITGTNGKSTTTALIAHILNEAGFDAQMGGNIGKPILELEPPSREHPKRVHVIEVSSFQIDLAPSLAPSIGVLLNISPDHLDRHGTMEAYAAIKERLVAAATELAVVGVDDPFGVAIGKRIAQGAKRLLVASESDDPNVDLSLTARQLKYVDQGRAGLAANLPEPASLRGQHNAWNAAFAFAVADCCFRIERDKILSSMSRFPGLSHRLEVVGVKNGVLFVNDSKATNADSTEKALASFPPGIFWILGGKPKEGGIESLAPHFPRVARAYLIGEATEMFARTLDGKVNFTRCETLDAAVAKASRDADLYVGRSPVVLLSPACASYDQFKSFEARGDLFRALVRDLLAAPHSRE